MTGKASLLVVMGFSLIFLIVGNNFGVVSNEAVKNYIEYNTETIAHNIAVSGANIAANGLFKNNSWVPSGYPKAFQGGSLNVTLINGTYREVVSTATYQGTTDVVRFTLTPNSFSEYAYYSTYERSAPGGGNIWWIGGDVVWGPFHTQDDFRVYDHPEFRGSKTSHKGSIIYYDKKSKDAPIITGVYETGKDITIPTNAVENLEADADNNGLKFDGHDTVYVKFDSDTLRYKYKFQDKYTAVYLPTAAPNGLIYAKNTVLRLQGTVKGQYTIGCTSSTSSTGKGTVWLDDDIVYATNPKIDPTSTDLLGILAENYVYITDNAANSQNKDINIHASVFCQKWGFGAANHDGRINSGKINLIGGIQQNYRQPVGTFNSSTGKRTGFLKQYFYDDRLGSISPPFYPGTGGFKIISWLE